MKQTTIYLIDDNPDIVSMLGEVVTLAGMTPRGFTVATQFFEQIKTFSPGSVLVLDLDMPLMDGIEVMRRLATLSLSPALILMSGHDTGVLHSAEQLGRAHHLEIIATLCKPIQLDKFKLLLEQYGPQSAQRQTFSALENDGKVSVAELKEAIRVGELVLHYQPQIDLGTGKVVGAEALVRWQHPTKGLIFPAHFIALAEQSGIMGGLTHWVIDQAIKQERLWRAEGIQLAVSVNISAVDITSLTLPEQLATLLMDNKLDPTRLTLEVTEGVLMGELVTSLDILTRLRLKGIGLSIDDFGTGYSSLSQLHRIPFSELKVDRTFVSNMGQDKEARAIVKTCIVLGHELNMKIVAEGVETEEQLDLLKQMGCDQAQGYFFSKPIEPTAFKAYLTSH